VLDRILDFIKNKYFIGAITLLIVFIVVNSVLGYYSNKANEAEFKKFVEINEEFSVDESDSNTLYDELDLNFDSYGYELITKTILAKKAVDEANFDLALNLYLEMHKLILDKNINKATKNILKEQYAENIVRIYMEKNDFDGGSNFIKENTTNSLRFHELAGDFYKFFEKSEDSLFHYDKALTFDIDEAQKNIINLKKPREK
jgi:predicted negative regulator of RcsB-dependent stress response|tara:strand:- start:8576 stop:9181 length:606 start_codon:yes stop_codon:yes gene_type:complete